MAFSTDPAAAAGDAAEAGSAADAVAGIDTARVRAVLFLCGMSSDALDDGVQQVRLKALQQPPGSLRQPAAWAVTVASRVAADWHRGRAREQRLVAILGAQAAVAAGPGDAGEVESRALAVSVAAGLQRLSPEQRRLVVLRFYADLSVRQIAQELEVPEGTVKSRLHTAVAAMRAEWRAEVSGHDN